MEMVLRCAVAVLSVLVILGTPGSDAASSKECLIRVTARNDSDADCNIGHCIECNEPSPTHDMTCLTCRDFHGLATNTRACVECALVTDCLNCTDVDNNGFPECFICTDNHSPIRGGSECLDCTTITNCDTCDVDADGNTVCLSCTGAFSPSDNGNRCMNCADVNAQCLSCEDHDDDATPEAECCITCNPRFFVSDDRESCIACDDGAGGGVSANCLDCTDTDTDGDADECSECATGYFVNPGNTCTACEAGCDACTDATTCTTCSDGFVLVNADCIDLTVCRGEDPNCDVCTIGPPTCTGCSSGYMLNTGGTCTQCSLLDHLCTECADGSDSDDDPDTCTECQDRAFVNSAGDGCVACNTLDNCLNCTDIDGNDIAECILCIDGYEPRADGSACYRPDSADYESSIELNGKTIFTDYHVYSDLTPLVEEHPAHELVLISISPDCDVYYPYYENRNMEQFLFYTSADEADILEEIDELEKFIWEVPYGTYLVGIYMSNTRAEDDLYTQTVLQTLRSLGAPVNSSGEAEEDLSRLGDGDYNSGVTLLFVGRKGMPEYGVGKYMHDLPGERVLEDNVHLDLSGVSPLPSSDIVWSVPMYQDVDITSILDKTYISNADVLRHDGHVYGWELIAADISRCVADQEVASFGIWRRESRHSNTTNLIHRTTLYPNMTWDIQDIGTTQYMCEANPVDIKLGDMYGIIVNDECLPVQANLCDDLSQVPVGTRFDDLDVTRYDDNLLFYCQGIEPYPCGRVGTQYDREWYWMTDTDWDLNQGADIAFDAVNDEFPNNIPTLFAFRPITDPGFLYTCGCMEDNDCHVKGDRNMVCDDLHCKCAEGFMYHRKTNRCVRDMAHGQTAWQSTTYKEYTAELALDNITATDDLDSCSMTQNMYDPNDNTLNSEKNKFPSFFVVDLGAEALVGAVTLTPPDTIKSYVVLYYSTNTHDVHNTTEPITPGYVRVIVYGFGFWKIYTEPTYTGDSIVLRGPGEYDVNTAMRSVGSLGVVIKRLDVYHLYANSDFCLYEDATTELRLTADTSECRLFYYDADKSRSIHIYPSDETFKAGCLANCPVIIGGTDATETTDDNYDIIKLTINFDHCLQVESMSEDARILTREYRVGEEETDCTTFTRIRTVEDYPLINAFNIQERDWRNPNDNGVNDEDASYTFTAVNVPDGLQDICIEWTTDEEELANVTYVYLHQKYGNEFIVKVIGKNLEGTASFRDDFGFEQVYFFSPKHLHNFEIVVTNDVEEFGFVSGIHDQRCATFTGNIAPGHTHTIDCDKPVYGRYVALVSLYPNRGSTYFHGFSLCDIQVQGLPVVLHGSSCTYNRDCRITDDYPMYCNDGVCDCLDGFHFSTTAGICIDTNECLVNYPNTTCDYFCYNYDGGYRCECPDGYQNYPDLEHGPECENINECLVENGDCAQICVDEVGDYHCECQPGFVLTNDTGTCQDIDECSHPDLHQCDEELTGRAKCDNLLGSYTCWCPFMSWGIEYDPVGNHCLNISFCEYNNGGCQHICTPSDGDDHYNVICECEEGYYLSDNMKSCIDIDECLQNPPVCGPIGTCHNHVGHYECECPAGYMFNNGTVDCEDMDECDYINTPPEYKALCEHNCTNTYGWYECSCDEGYALRDDKYTCFDIDECLIPATCGRDDGSPEICTNTIGSYICSCKDGYRFNDDNEKCETIDECLDNNGGCEHTCKDGPLFYTCGCDDGYELQNNEHSCWKKDQCGNTSQCTQLCQEIADTNQFVVGYECSCKPGYELNLVDLISCSNVNECTDYYYYGHCEGTCTDTEGSYKCGCGDGFILNPNQHSCDDINECAGRPCEEMCVNTYGSFECQCPTGFRLRDRYSCEDINECEEDSHHCSHGCANTRGSYKCTCPDGYILLANDWICADENECDRVASICDVTETCVNYLGSYECKCPEGMYRPNEFSDCIDMNECEDHNGGCHHTCTNIISSYTCSCHPGYELSSNKHSCIDTDECMVSNGGCKHKCVNEPGSYRCMCNYGYVMSVDGTDCLSLDRRVLMQLVLDMSWLDEYHDARSAETRELIREIEQQMFIITDAMLDQFGLLKFTVVQLFRGSVGVILSASFSAEITVDDESEIRFLINQAIQENDRTLNILGRRVPLIGSVDLAFYNTDGSLQTGLITDACDDFRRFKYCRNDGMCKIDANGKPECECTSGYSGAQCQDSVYLLDTDIAFISILVVLFVMIIAGFLIMCVLYTRLQSHIYRVSDRVEDKDSYSNQFYPRNYYRKSPWIWSGDE